MGTKDSVVHTQPFTPGSHVFLLREHLICLLTEISLSTHFLHKNVSICSASFLSLGDRSGGGVSTCKFR